MTTTTLLSDIFSLEDLKSEIEAGYVRERRHPDEPLAILNYSETTAYERRWNDVTRNCRGLIYNTETLAVVSRPWKKFGNWDESGYPYPPVGPMIMAPKFDGSLGILYKTPNGELGIATRGSFESDQAKHGTKRFHDLLHEVSDLEQWDGLVNLFEDPTYTFLFEIIYPENRIVVDYKGKDRMVLLDVIETSTGLQRIDVFDGTPWPDKSPKILVSEGFSHSIVDQIPSGEEGFVLSWPTRGFMCKMKSAEYVELHRMVTGLSKKSVWEAMGRGELASVRENVPDELYGWFDETVSELQDAIQYILDQAYTDFDTVRAELRASIPEPSQRTRGDFARIASQYTETRQYLFRIFDGAQPEDLWQLAWKRVKPVGDTRAWGRGEDVA